MFESLNGLFCGVDVKTFVTMKIVNDSSKFEVELLPIADVDDS